MAPSWSLDFCMACDRQCTTGEAYCSQSCRLADLDTSYASEPTTPLSTNHSASSSLSSRSVQSNGFILPPAFDFSAYRTKPTSTKPVDSSSPSLSSSVSAHTRRRPQAMDLKAVSRRPSSRGTNSPSPRILTPSSSRSSLSSTQGSPLQSEFLSSRTRSELQDYTNSFDHVRDWRRRLTTT